VQDVERLTHFAALVTLQRFVDTVSNV
jgi:hypothetical protein